MSRVEVERLFELAVAAIDDEELRKIVLGVEAVALSSAVLEDDDAVGGVPIHMLIREMSIPEKMKTALLGGRTARSLLVRDNNKQIPPLVLRNPRLTENEVLEYAKNTDLDEGVHRIIAQSGQWMKAYGIKLAIVFNPKVSPALSLRWLKHLRDQDLRRLSKSKNIPQVVSVHGRKILEERQKNSKTGM